MIGPWTGNPALSMPLLDSTIRQNIPEESRIDIGDHQRPLLLPQRASDTPLHFLRRLGRLVAELQPYQAILLAVLSILESIIVAHVGKVAGSFYHIVIEKETSAFLTMLLHAGILYAACIATSTAGVWLSGRLAVRWRRHLTTLLHRRYCSHLAFLNLPAPVDNPDQRITAETSELCDALGSAARLAAGAPFRVGYYTWIAWQYLGWHGTAAAFLFFWVAAAMQRLVVVPLARCVVAQEKKEGNLRFAHLRLRDRGPDIAAYRGSSAELACLNGALGAVVRNQKSLIGWRSAVNATTKATDYFGALLNYGLVAAVVFSGAAGAASPGDLAQFVSNASFASLSLIYSFTELLDLGEKVSSLAALTARVVGLLEALPETPEDQNEQEDSLNTTERSEYKIFFGLKRRLRPARGTASARGGSYVGLPSGDIGLENNMLSSYSAARSRSDEIRELQPSGFATMLQPPSEVSFFAGAVSMEVSVHSLGADLKIEARGIFPELPSHAGSAEDASLLCVLTFQFAGGGSIDLSPDRSSPTLTLAATEMDCLLERFLRWEAALRGALAARGTYWCNAVDPRSGMALHGTQGLRWSEVAAARALLRYDRRDAGVCPLVVHPVHGTSAYPVSFFTNAPADVLFEALSSLAIDNKNPALQPQLLQSTPIAFPRLPPLLAVQGLSYSTPDMHTPLASNLTFSVTPGHWVLISGPNGAGKSTLLRVLSGLHPATAGTLQFSPELQLLPLGDPFSDPSTAMFLPQRPLTAPGTALWQQIAYPKTYRPSDDVLRMLLSDVGLAHLLERTGGSFESPGNGLFAWSSALSVGEMQRLAIARVLLHRPKLALLDEPCSAMGDAAAKVLLSLLRRAGVTCVTVAQDTQVYREMHDVHVELG